MKKQINVLMRDFINNKGVKLSFLSIKTKIPYDKILSYFSKCSATIKVEDYFEICNVLDIEPKYFIDSLKKGE